MNRWLTSPNLVHPFRIAIQSPDNESIPAFPVSNHTENIVGSQLAVPCWQAKSWVTLMRKQRNTNRVEHRCSSPHAHAIILPISSKLAFPGSQHNSASIVAWILRRTSSQGSWRFPPDQQSLVSLTQTDVAFSSVRETAQCQAIGICLRSWRWSSYSKSFGFHSFFWLYFSGLATPPR